MNSLMCSSFDANEKSKKTDCHKFINPCSCINFNNCLINTDINFNRPQKIF